MLPNRRNLSKDDFSCLRKNGRKTQRSFRESLFRNSPNDHKNFSNHSQGESMPIILNVFSLCDASDSNGKEMKRNICQENSMPVISPCSPPFALIEQETTSIISENYGVCYESRTCLPYGFTNSSNPNSAVPINCHTYNSVEKVTHFPQKITNGFTGQPPQLQNHKKHTIEYRPKNKTAEYSSSVANGNFTRNDQLSFLNGKSPIFPQYNEYLAQKGRVMFEESNSSIRKKSHCDSKEKVSAKRQYVFAKLVQHIQRNQCAKSKGSKITSKQLKSSCR